MDSGKWIPVKSERLLAQRWGVSLQIVKAHVTEAFRHRRLAMGERVDALIENKMAQCEADRELALKRKKYLVVGGKIVAKKDPDVKAAVAANRLALESLGALVKINASRQGEDDYETLDLQALKSMHEKGTEALRELDDRIKELEGGLN